MPDRKLFDAVSKNINKFEIRLENYTIPSLQTSKLNKVQDPEENQGPEGSKVHVTTKEPLKGPKPSGQEQASKAPTNVVEAKPQKHSKGTEKPQQSPAENEETLEEKAIREKNEIAARFAAFSEKQVAEQPKLCMWFYMTEENVKSLLGLTSKQKIRESIGNKMNLEYPKGISRVLAIELMFSVVRFCQKSKFSVIQSGTLLSIFYLTHEYFLNSFYTTAENIYCFFKEYMLLHCFECPPDSMELFNYKESTDVVRYFCTLYLQNLPLIRLLTLPNFGFYLNYEKQPDPFEEMGKKGKGKDKGGKKPKK